MGIRGPSAFVFGTALLGFGCVTGRTAHVASPDPVTSLERTASTSAAPAPPAALDRAGFDVASMRALVESLVGCGTRSSLSSWSDPARGIGCGRDKVVARLREIAGNGPLQVVVDDFQATSPHVGPQPFPLENVYAVLPGSDPNLSQTVFIVAGHLDSRPTEPMDATSDAPGADDDASGVALTVECARRLAQAGPHRATLVFAVLAGEEQGLFGGSRLLEWVKQKGWRVGGMLEDDIVGADPAPGAPHRVRLYAGGGDLPDGDSVSRELARAIEETGGRDAIRLVFRAERLGRASDEIPFYKAGLPAVRFAEPLEDYRHEHQTPRLENGFAYGDVVKNLDFAFLARVTAINADALHRLALAPEPPQTVKLSGAVTPDAKVSWTAADDAQRAGFELLWRETTDPRWHVHAFQSTAGQMVLSGVSTDDYFFAVRSVGKNGARSIAAPAE